MNYVGLLGGYLCINCTLEVRKPIPEMKINHTILLWLLVSPISMFGQATNSSPLQRSIDSLNHVVHLRGLVIDSILNEQELSSAILQNYLNSLQYEDENDSVLVCILGITLNKGCAPYHPILGIEAGKKVHMLNDTNERYYYIRYGNDTGFASKYHLVTQSKYKAIYRNELRTTQYQQVLQKHRKDHLIKIYGSTNGMNIFNGKIWVGMPYDVLLDLWGRPDRGSSVRLASKPQEPRFLAQYGGVKFYFENEKLAFWEISE